MGILQPLFLNSEVWKNTTWSTENTCFQPIVNCSEHCLLGYHFFLQKRRWVLRNCVAKYCMQNCIFSVSENLHFVRGGPLLGGGGGVKY